MPVVRVPIVEDHDNCVLEHILPHPNCTNPGYWVELLMQAAQLLIVNSNSSEPLQYRFIKVSKYGNTHSEALEDDDSVYGMLHSGKADITFPGMFLTYERAKRFPNIGVLQRYTLFHVYKTVETAPPTLNFLSIFKSWESYLTFVVLLAVLKFVGKLTRKATNSFAKGKLKRSDFEAKSFKSLKYFSFTVLLSSLVASVLLNYLASAVILLLNSPKPHRAYFQSVDDLVESWASGEYKPMALLPTVPSIKTLLRAKGHFDTPVSVTKWPQKSIANIVSQNLKATVVVGYLIMYILHSQCGICVLQDRKSPTEYVTIYVSHQTPFTVNSLTDMTRTLLRKEGERLVKKYYPPLLCNLENAMQIYDTPPLRQLSPKQPLGMFQVAYLFYLIGILLMIASVLFGMELLCKKNATTTKFTVNSDSEFEWDTLESLTDQLQDLVTKNRRRGRHLPIHIQHRLRAMVGN